MKIQLTPEQKARLEEQHRLSRDHRVRDRIRCVLLYADGWSARMIAQSQLIHETTVLRHIADYRRSEKGFSDNGGSQGHLSVEQNEELKRFLTKNTLVTTGAIIAHVKEQYGISYSVPGMSKWLHRNGFSYKKPVGVPHKFDADKQQAFIEKYNELKQTAGKKEPILFMDAVHPTQSTKLSYGWLPKGERKAVATTGSRTRMNLIGALSLRDIARTVVCEYPRINSETVSEFFTAIRKAWPLSQKIHLILDGAPYHKTPLVKKQALKMNIELHYLPPYSPNLNPIERLWKVMNQHARNNRYFATAKDFRAAINGFFKNTLPEIAGTLTCRINDHFQKLKPASSN